MLLLLLVPRHVAGPLHDRFALHLLLGRVRPPRLLGDGEVPRLLPLLKTVFDLRVERTVHLLRGVGSRSTAASSVAEPTASAFALEEGTLLVEGDLRMPLVLEGIGGVARVGRGSVGMRVLVR